MRNLLTQAFTNFLRRRHAQRHFARRPPLATLVKQDAAAEIRAPFSNDLLQAAHDDPAGAIAQLQSHADGLTAEEATRRLQQYGPNEIAHEKPLSPWLRLWRCYLNPFNLLLTVLAFLSWFSADAKATIVIGVMVTLRPYLRSWTDCDLTYESAGADRRCRGWTTTQRRARSCWRPRPSSTSPSCIRALLQESEELAAATPALRVRKEGPPPRHSRLLEKFQLREVHRVLHVRHPAEEHDQTRSVLTRCRLPG